MRVRQALGLGAINSVDDITDDPVVRQRLKKAFTRPATPGATPTLQITDIDLLTGSLAEPHVRGSSLGRTFFTIFTETLDQIRTSDRHWFERPGSLSCNSATDAAMREQILNTDFGDILARNTQLQRFELPKNVFFTDSRRITRAHLAAATEAEIAAEAAATIAAQALANAATDAAAAAVEAATLQVNDSGSCTSGLCSAGGSDGL